MSSWKQVSGTRRENLRRWVLTRDRGICHLCGTRGATTVDHLTPRSRGGTDDPWNLAAAHAHCNYAVGSAPMIEPLSLEAVLTVTFAERVAVALVLLLVLLAVAAMLLG